ncbi:MAG TPA: YgjP-like metallopeptidase domain-containing protein [Sphingomicrobium sp.]|nr:YgjP-like metallopeptidase domain-containing protein [Sphingomicrobium sp.]
MWLSGRSDALKLADELPVSIEIRSIRGARRLRLRYDDARGVLKLTCPVRTSRRAALAWALDQREWIDTQLARSLPGEPFAPNAIIPIEGRETRLIWEKAAARTPRFDSGELRCGGPEAGFERRIAAFLKRHAIAIMSREAVEFAGVAGAALTGVSIGDAGTRWGSCTSEGRIRLSWRLILAPPEVRRFVVAHEVAHLVHLNHGAAFKALEARLFGPGLAEAKANLRRIGPRLRRVGRR